MADTVLVAEDVDVLREVLVEVLRKEGYEVLPAADGQEALEVLLRRPTEIRCALLDWYMPRMNGIDLLRRMKGERDLDGIPVVFLTGLPEPALITEAIEAGAFYFLAKPAQSNVLCSIVRAAIDDRRYKEALLHQLATCQNPLSMLVEGRFRFRTLEEGQRLATIIANASPSPLRALTVNEIFVNAVEHGNLGVSYEEKGELVQRGEWKAEIDRRLNLPEHREKYVRVEIQRRAEGMFIHVEDDGPGFDFRRYLQFDTERVFDTHGRGIAMASAAFSLAYENGGRAVRVTIAND
jgi:CheY-like chemotaxis protein